jgi:hypothetical protein
MFVFILVEKEEGNLSVPFHTQSVAKVRQIIELKKNICSLAN